MNLTIEELETIIKILEDYGFEYGLRVSFEDRDKLQEKILKMKMELEK